MDGVNTMMVCASSEEILANVVQDSDLAARAHLLGWIRTARPPGSHRVQNMNIRLDERWGRNSFARQFQFREQMDSLGNTREDNALPRTLLVLNWKRNA